MPNRSALAGAFAALMAAAALAPWAVGPAVAAESEAEIVNRVNAYLNALTTMRGSFIQVGPDGTIKEGLFNIRRPGRMRFEYTPPDPTIVISDGVWVAVIDEVEDSSIDRYPLFDTPLFLVLKDDVDLNAEGAVKDVVLEENQYRVTAWDPSGETQGDVTLVFDAEPLQLRQWVVTDLQGQTTRVVLREAEEGVALDAALFVIPEPERPWNDRRRND